MVCKGTSLQEINIQAQSIRLSTALCIYILINLSTPTTVYTLHIEATSFLQWPSTEWYIYTQGYFANIYCF